ncbi:MAG: hypothetical protein SNI45_04320 [Rikenellaceae bacterium]
MKTQILLIPLCGLLLTSCATVFCGSKQNVLFTSNVDEPSKFTIDGIPQNNVTFPYTAKVKRGFSSTLVSAEAEGYQPVILEIEKKFNAVSVLNLTDILGWGIDAATGAITKPEHKGYELNFEAKE